MPRNAGASLLGLGFFIAVSLAAGWFGARYAPGEWYAQLRKPAWTPPNWAFPAVWTVLYVLMGVAAWGVWRREGWERGWPALRLFFVQLVLNALWSWLFFGEHRIGLAMFELLALWVAILATAVLFWRREPWAGALLLPYLLWVTYAATLNAGLWWLNR